MTYTLRAMQLFALLFFASILALGCNDELRGSTQGGVPIGGECSDEALCSAGSLCVDSVCVADSNNGDPDAGSKDDDTGSTNGGDPDADTDAGTGGDAGDSDADSGPTEPPCHVQVSCDDHEMECGHIPNGCGGLKSCGSCAETEYCGEGLDHGKCIEIACVPNLNACADAGIQCGAISDGCGGSVDCGTCAEGAVCGNGATRGQCIAPETCTPATTCTGTRYECGPMPDGCGGFIQCGGGCGTGETCKAGICTAPVCVPKTAADFANMACGIFSDGCGGFVDSGKVCGAGKVCGKGADRGKCVTPVCVPLTKDDYAGIANCGLISDGCNGIINLGNTCTAPDICGGSGVPNSCGSENRGGNCEGLCQQQAACANGAATTLSGTVFAPEGSLAIPNVTVYVPNVPLSQLPAIDDNGAVCERCEDEDLGKPLVGTVSDKSGNFTLRHVPAGVEFPLVIKAGKWRRVVMIPSISACQNVNLTTHPDFGPEYTSLPKTQGGATGHDSIPKTAVSTGSIDAIECVLHKLGVDDSEFTDHKKNGRVHIYRGNGGYPPGYGGCANGCTDGSKSSCSTECAEQLSSVMYKDQAKLDGYDVVIADCEASTNRGWHDSTERTNLLNYVNKGGRFFASHYGYTWLDQTVGLKESANWGNSAQPGSTIAFVNESTSRGQDFAYWLGVVGAKYGTNGVLGQTQVQISSPRNYVTSVNGKSMSWVHTVDGQAGHVGTSVQQFSFNTPYSAPEPQECGRVVYSAFHVTGTSPNHRAFPAYCSSGGLTAQEKVLAFMLFDLASCIRPDGPPPEPVCIPRNCTEMNAMCGSASDGCDGEIQCGDCPNGMACGVDAPPNQCGGVCRPISCEEAGANCGVLNDGCGNQLDCGTCGAGETCGGGGELNVCGCELLSCEDHGAECGTVNNGCGGTLDCGSCGAGQACSKVGGVNQCVGECAPLSCDDHGAQCGKVSNGCGGTLNCGPCTAPETCGGGGVRNQCGAGQCEPLTCDDHGAQCGPVSDGCGGTLECGDCPFLEVCDNMQCKMPACKPTGQSCIDDLQCCGGVCAIGPNGQGICIAN